MKAKYDADHDISYGYYECPICGAKFYGGGRALHNTECSERDYGNCIYVFGPKESLHFAPTKLHEEITKIMSEVK